MSEKSCELLISWVRIKKIFNLKVQTFNLGKSSFKFLSKVYLERVYSNKTAKVNIYERFTSKRLLFDIKLSEYDSES